MVAQSLLILGARQKHIILCTREFQNSIRDSVIGLLKSQAIKLGLYNTGTGNDFYEFQKDIVYGKNGTVFIFKGLHLNAEQSVKSTEGITIAWLEEAQTATQESIDVLIPTINRNEGAQMIVTFNTGMATDPVYTNFVLDPPPNSYVCKVNYDENPFLPDAFIQYALRMRERDYEKYCHIYLGEPWHTSEAQILKNKISVREFELPTLPEKQNEDGTPNPYYELALEELNKWSTYYGLDWGFSVDPMAAVKVHIYDNTLFIEYEYGGTNIEIRDFKEFFAGIDGLATFPIRADRSRPELVSHVQQLGINIVASESWNGSVEDGVAFLLSFDEIVIHPRCKEILQESKLYSYKVDRHTGDVLPIIVDRHNHYWDATRYAIEPLIKRAPDPMIRML